ncbi:MAG TPA: hypothetical protein PK006_07345 [Saprospiraceae bacterium]|nr:hypothetical protein [Saprospiraceae bacterium]
MWIMQFELVFFDPNRTKLWPKDCPVDANLDPIEMKAQSAVMDSGTLAKTKETHLCLSSQILFHSLI